jgi:hypothetical protein
LKKYILYSFFLFIVTASVAKASNVDSIFFKDGSFKLLETKIQIISNSKSDFFCKINDTLIPFKLIDYCSIDSYKFINCNDKRFIKLLESGQINMYSNNYFQVGNDGKLQKQTYTNIYEAIQSDKVALKILIKEDKKTTSIKTMVLGSTLIIGNMIMILARPDQFNLTFGENTSVISSAYFVLSGIAFSVSIPVFCVASFIGTVRGTRKGRKESIRVYNTNATSRINKQ